MTHLTCSRSLWSNGWDATVMLGLEGKLPEIPIAFTSNTNTTSKKIAGLSAPMQKRTGCRTISPP
ncbi:hypothetical protein MFFC18_08470 [Mariniblastus fucicola]|uniref:Uncharacterized protein n=1 Tax=Mariniblastus fucicola TaxID=980251 RepID=A0A5B9P8Q2_9BACT|nr:hypothetical protein MFFC18_08470 [Mariniblastus fucicola]